MPFTTPRERLARRATLLKKSWLLAAAMCGKYNLGGDANVPDYENWSRLRLQQQVLDLEADLRDALGFFMKEAIAVTSSAAIVWLAERYEAWGSAGWGLFTISTVREFDVNVAPMYIPQLDVPPYTELLLQPGVQVAFRHPEYMLARDLGY